MKLYELFSNLLEDNQTGKIRLYRGLEGDFDKDYDLSKTDAPDGYSTWTDNHDLARQYAGEAGKVYYIDLNKSDMGNNYIDDNPKSETHGDRYLFFPNEKKAGLHGVSGNEFLVYNYHDLYDSNAIKQYTEI